jgi:hypothetical protein
MPRCPLFGRSWGISGRRPDNPFRVTIDPLRTCLVALNGRIIDSRPTPPLGTNANRTRFKGMNVSSKWTGKPFRAGGVYSPALGYSNAGGRPRWAQPPVNRRASELERPQCNCPCAGAVSLSGYSMRWKSASQVMSPARQPMSSRTRRPTRTARRWITIRPAATSTRIRAWSGCRNLRGEVCFGAIQASATAHSQ